MGWLYMQSLGPYAGPRQYLDAQLTQETPDRRRRVLRSALVRMRTYYAALEVTGADGTREVVAVVCLVRHNPRARNGYVFGYKDLDETMGPCEAECPAGILDLLTPTVNAHALEWRARCRAHAAARAERPALRAGQVVVFDEPIAFADGRTLQRLEVVIEPRRPRAVRFREPGGSGLYRVGRLDAHRFRVEGA